MTINEARKIEVTPEIARKELPAWLSLATMNTTFSGYDLLCSKAYDILGHDEYGKIHTDWEKNYIYCSDGYYRLR